MCLAVRRTWRQPSGHHLNLTRRLKGQPLPSAPLAPTAWNWAVQSVRKRTYHSSRGAIWSVHSSADSSTVRRFVGSLVSDATRPRSEISLTRTFARSAVSYTHLRAHETVLDL